ncbi:hypothetical protein GPECTOR_119g411 [Gonium pectorale]|uniref:SAC domain-containing protein n=1 Tax=Gonium pectorale TaxID=33097 RepID=A0A150G0D7_GONPE|nr:hypothetical protein GPECTOR_119g411 [Gonium pectorale]|eukprot:KXZ42780.1 hypothetical protein GPECTOR_119g411 [Gonium pectorale]
MVGYIGQATGATFELRQPLLATREPAAAEETGGGGAAAGGGARVPGDLTLIARVGVERPVAGGWRRGADRQGHAAGFAETEVVLTLWQELGGQPAGGDDAEPSPSASAAGGAGEAGRAEGPPAPEVQRSRCRVAVASYVMVAAHGTAPSGSASLVGLPLSRTELPQLAACGPAAARLEALCAAELRSIRAFASVDELEMAVRTDAAGSAAGAGGGGGRAAARSVSCVSRRVGSWQRGVVRVSSASTASAGGACEEVDLAQHALALPVLAELLAALGALDDPADLAAAHGGVMLGGRGRVAMCAWQRITGLTDLATRVAAPGLLSVALLADVLRRGAAYVEQPLLLPGAVYPWAQP